MLFYNLFIMLELIAKNCFFIDIQHSADVENQMMIYVHAIGKKPLVVCLKYFFFNLPYRENFNDLTDLLLLSRLHI